MENSGTTINKVESEKPVPKPYTGKKRGRKSKTEQEKLEAAQKRKLAKELNVSIDKTEETPIQNPEQLSKDEHNELINKQALAHLYHRREFVCDRCNSLRRACFGTLSSCNNCLIANKECTLKRPRIRKSKPRKLKAVNMDVSLDQSVDLSQMVPMKQTSSIENDRVKQLEETVFNLTNELKITNHEKKLSEEHYKELETENDYLKETISTLQQLFKEQQNLVQLLEKQQIQNLRKLKMLQNAKHDQLQQNSMSNTRNLLDINVSNRALAQNNSAQFQLYTQERREWLAHINNNSSVNSPANGSTISHYNVAHSESTHTKNVSPQSIFINNNDIESNRLSYDQVQAQLNNITNKKILEENEVNSISGHADHITESAPPPNSNNTHNVESSKMHRQAGDFF